MNKKGFSLIELLGVIIILAIIVLIITPVVMGVIEDSRAGAAERSVENYIDAVETSIMRAKMKGIQIEEKYYLFNEGNLCPDGINCEAEPDKVIKVDINGNIPSNGSIYIENGAVRNNSIIKIGDYTLNYNSDKKTYVATVTEPICTYVSETGTQEETIGAKYTCKLDTERTFYVLENNEFSENISLIMDSNFLDNPKVKRTLAWCLDGGEYNTCKNINSKEEGTPLKHIQDTFGRNVEVSLPTYDQIYAVNNGINLKSTPWLYGNLSPLVGGDRPYAYWTASPNTFSDVGDANKKAWHVDTSGILGRPQVALHSYTGVRPVITIPKFLVD